MAAPVKGEKTINVVNQNAIWVETILKEQRHMKLYTHFSINPFRTMHRVTGKPNSFQEAEEGEEDPHFGEIIKRANDVPTHKYTEPQTSSQEIGWMTQPLTDVDRLDERFYFPLARSEMTKIAEVHWLEKDQMAHALAETPIK